MVKKLPAMQETQVRSLDGEDPLEKGVATYKYKWYSCLENSMDRSLADQSPWVYKKLDMTKQLTHIV